MMTTRQILIWNPMKTKEMLEKITKIFKNKKSYWIQHEITLDDTYDDVDVINKDFAIIVDIDVDEIRNYIAENGESIWQTGNRARVEEVSTVVKIPKLRSDFNSYKEYLSETTFSISPEVVRNELPIFSISTLNENEFKFTTCPFVLPLNIRINDNLEARERKIVTDWSMDKLRFSTNVIVGSDNVYLSTLANDQFSEFGDMVFTKSDVQMSFNGQFIISDNVSPQLSSPRQNVWQDCNDILLDQSWVYEAVLNALHFTLIDLNSDEVKKYRYFN